MNALTVHAVILYIQLISIILVFIFSERSFRRREAGSVHGLLFCTLALSFLSGLTWLVFCGLLVLTTPADWLWVGISIEINILYSVLYFLAAVAASLLYIRQRNVCPGRS